MANKIKTIGVLTSGGDAPGMNAAIRAVVRRGISKDLKVVGIKRGYAGLLNEEIIDMDAKSVSDSISRGGTILQTARCMEFVTPEGQQKGAEICRKHGVTVLFVTHDIEEAVVMADRIGVMEANLGRIKEIIENTYVKSYQKEEKANLWERLVALMA